MGPRVRRHRMGGSFFPFRRTSLFPLREPVERDFPHNEQPPTQPTPPFATPPHPPPPPPPPPNELPAFFLFVRSFFPPPPDFLSSTGARTGCFSVRADSRQPFSDLVSRVGFFFSSVPFFCTWLQLVGSFFNTTEKHVSFFPVFLFLPFLTSAFSVALACTRPSPGVPGTAGTFKSSS